MWLRCALKLLEGNRKNHALFYGRMHLCHLAVSYADYLVKLSSYAYFKY
jgi:hypothetical protein